MLVARKEIDEMKKTLDKVRAQLAARETCINELKDDHRDMEKQLDEALENSAHKAHAITVGANIMMAEQFTQTQHEFADLREYINKIRAEHAAFVMEAQVADAATAASSEELERVLSDLSDETYMTASSTYDASDD